MIDNQRGSLDMAENLLILGGTTEASALCRALAEREITATLSLAGRVDRPLRQPLPQRVGGFGGADGLARYLVENKVSHVVDATHPFASAMSHNAVAGCAQAGVPLIALTRAPWAPEAGDDWHNVPDIAGAVAALDRPAARVLLAVGRMHLAEFAPNPQHFYLLRLVDPPKAQLSFPDYHVIVDRGPFSVENDLQMMRDHQIDLVVSKNSGGTGAFAKLAAARALSLPVLMIDRPAMPQRAEAHSIDEVLGWLAHSGVDQAGVDLGV
jgi:precorrin-6A/cobalt-precorrin-6A reductase